MRIGPQSAMCPIFPAVIPLLSALGPVSVRVLSADVKRHSIYLVTLAPISIWLLTG